MLCWRHGHYESSAGPRKPQSPGPSDVTTERIQLHNPPPSTAPLRPWALPPKPPAVTLMPQTPKSSGLSVTPGLGQSGRVLAGPGLNGSWDLVRRVATKVAACTYKYLGPLSPLIIKISLRALGVYGVVQGVGVLGFRVWRGFRV